MNLPISHGDIPGISDLHEIGRGGFGVVYRAQEADLGRTVAVKVLTGNFDDRARSRFDRERRAMGTLSGHPNIVHVYRSGYTDDGAAYIVMEYHEAGSCADLLTLHGPMPWRRALEFGVALCGAVETAHREGVLHRDIKPGNILMSRLHQPKLADFGIARLHDQPETRTGSVTASVAHAAPEILDGQRAHAGTDVYSLASTLYELVAGAPAFTRPTDESIVPLIARIARDPLPQLTDEVLPASVFGVLSTAMSKEPTDRYRTAEEFGRALAGMQAQMGLAQTPMMVEGEAAIVAAPPRRTASATTPVDTANNSGPQPAIQARTPRIEATPPTPHPATPSTAAFTTPGFAGARAGANIGSVPSTAPTPTPTPTPKQGSSTKFVIAGITLLLLFGFGALVGWLLNRDGSEQGRETDDIVVTDGGEDGPDQSSTTTTTTEPNNSSSSTSSSSTTSSTTSSTSTTTTSTTTTTEPPDDPPGDLQSAQGALSDIANLGNLRNYDDYDTITDDTGSITVDIPSEWGVRFTDPGVGGEPTIIASSEEIDGVIGSYDNPGILVQVTDFVEPLELLDSIEEDCLGNADGPWNLDDVNGDGTEGLIRIWATCPNAQAVVQHAAFHPPDRSYTVQLSIQMITELDVSAGARIVASLETSQP